MNAGWDPSSGNAVAIVRLKNGTLQVGMLHWYAANTTTQFSLGGNPLDVAFDGANIWVANNGSNTVAKLRSDDAPRRISREAVDGAVFASGDHLG